MSAPQDGAHQRQPAPPSTTSPGTELLTAPPRQRSSALVRVESALDECVGAICLVEVTLHSLEFQEIASPEQEVLKRALKAIWSVHDWIDELAPDRPDGEDPDGEDADDEGADCEDIDEEDTDEGDES